MDAHKYKIIKNTKLLLQLNNLRFTDALHILIVQRPINNLAWNIKIIKAIHQSATVCKNIFFEAAEYKKWIIKKFYLIPSCFKEICLNGINARSNDNNNKRTDSRKFTGNSVS
jgi:hypothetical protein